MPDPKVYENEVKLDTAILAPSEGKLSMYPNVIGQVARPTTVDYGNPRQAMIHVAPGEDISRAIIAMSEAGGGTVQLLPITYFVSQDISVLSNITLQGAGIGNTIIDFGAGAFSVNIQGSSRSTSGTATATEGSVTVTGVSTTFTNARAGDMFYVTLNKTNFYSEIASIESDTSLTLIDAWPMPNVATVTFSIIGATRNVGVRNLTVQNSAASGGTLNVDRVINCFFENLRVYKNTVGGGIEINTMLDSEFRNVESSYNGNATSDHGFEMQSMKRTSFYNCSANGNAGDGFNFASAGTSESGFYSCVADGNGSDGFSLDGDRLTFIACRAAGNDANGFITTSTSDRVAFSSCFTIDNGSDGIEVAGDDTTLFGCILDNNDSYGINIASTADNTRIINCSFVNTGTGTITDGGTNTYYHNVGMGTFTAANGANNNIDISESRFVRITGPTAAFSISGIAGGINGREVYLYNAVAFDFTITNDATSTAANRILTLTGADVVLTGVSVARLIYNATDARWILLGTQG